MLAYIAWHRPAAGVDRGFYEQALERFHRSLAHSPPSGFEGSQSFRAGGPPWADSGAEGAGAVYEDWYLVDGWSALGVLEEAAVGRGHGGRHEALAERAQQATGAVYRLEEGRSGLERARLSVWVSPARGQDAPTVADLLGDGMDPHGGLWRRCLGLGPAPEYCLLAPDAPAGVAPTRMPAGWSALRAEREALW